MKKVKANKNFELPVDITIGRPRQDGEIFIVEDGRAEQLEALGLVEILEDVEEKPKKKK